MKKLYKDKDDLNINIAQKILYVKWEKKKKSLINKTKLCII